MSDQVKAIIAWWQEEARKCERRGYLHMAANCIKIANSYKEEK